MVSRFRSRAEIKKILQDTVERKVDILIGTHRLLSKDVQFSDLGLLIIDEEQRFGVTHKEKIKEMKKNVDALNFDCNTDSQNSSDGFDGISSDERD